MTLEAGIAAELVDAGVGALIMRSSQVVDSSRCD
jgi:hypothetical protein